MRKTKIVATLGPSSSNIETLEKMIKKGMNVARFNFSHCSYEDIKDTVENLKKLRDKLNVPISLLADIKGPVIRINDVDGQVNLKKDDIITIKYNNVLGNKEHFSINYTKLYEYIKLNDLILIDDGKLKLKVIDIKNKDIVCKSLNDGIIEKHKGVNVPNISLDISYLSKKDKLDIRDAINNDFEYLSLSFVQRKSDILKVKKIIGKNNIKIIAKIENKEGYKNIDEILSVCDGIMVARGDLGVEVNYSEVPIIQKEIIKKTIYAGKLVITATQMLESMTTQIIPTRAEVSDVANAIYDGTSAIMLSGETANGMHPVECIETMDKIAKKIESSIDYWDKFNDKDILNDFEFIINHALLTPAKKLKVKAVFAHTKTGNTPRILSSLKPNCPIFITTSNKKIYNELALAFNVYPTYIKDSLTSKEMIEKNIKLKVKEKYLKKGDIILIAGGKYLPNVNKVINKNVGGIYQI